MFSSLLSGLTGKVLAGVSIVLFFLCGFFYISNKNKELEITKLTNSVSELSNRNSVLESQVENCKKQFESVLKAKQIQQEVIDKLNDNDQQTLSKLNQIDMNIERKNAETSNSGRPLPDDLIRVLSEHCDKVRGNACPSP